MDAFIGTILPWAGTYAPYGWAFCQGQTLQVNQYQAVYALLSNTYGGTYPTTFCLPDLRGRVPVGAGIAPGTGMNFIQGKYGGGTQVALTASNMPEHIHTATFTGTGGGGGTPLSVTATLKASTSSENTESSPAAGYVLAASKATTDSPDPVNVTLYKPINTQDQMVELGGLSTTVTGGTGGITGGTVAVNSSGYTVPTAISVLQPYQVINYIICLVGEYPMQG